MRHRIGLGTCAFWSAFIWMVAAVASAQIRTFTDSTRPVPAPNGARSIIVDRIFRVIDGEPERYPSRLLVRIVDTGGTITRQRRIDASQVRLLNPPRWIDQRWAAFTYNISKNANGVVYVDTLTAEALQIEFVALRRRMAASDSIETELTSFEVTEYARQVTRVSNITRRNRSVFPLFLRPLPPYDTSPFPWVFAEQVRAALQAYHEFLAKHGIRSLRLEEASESFDKEEKHLAALACVDGKPTVLLAPMEAATPAAALDQVRLVALDPAVALTCLAEVPRGAADEPTTSSVTEDTEPLGHFGEFRFRTSWRDENTALVEQEFFESEEQEARRVPLYALHLDGKVELLGTPTSAAPASLASNDELSSAPTPSARATDRATTDPLRPSRAELPTTSDRSSTAPTQQRTSQLETHGVSDPPSPAPTRHPSPVSSPKRSARRKTTDDTAKRSAKKNQSATATRPSSQRRTQHTQR